jgi:sec-independent protein translocase protein TatA
MPVFPWSTTVPAFFFGSPSMPEMIIVGIIALLLFGKRLPEVARSLGKGMREFKEGMAGIQNEFHSAYSTAARNENRPAASRPAPPDDDDRGEFVAPKFEPPPVEPAKAEPVKETG